MLYSGTHAGMETAATQDSDLPLPPPKPAAAAAAASGCHVTPHQSMPATQPSARLSHASAHGANSPVDGSSAALALAYDSPASSSHSRSRLRDLAMGSNASDMAANAPLPPESLQMAPNTRLPPQALQVAQQKAQCLSDLLSRQFQASGPAQMPRRTAAASTACAQAAVQTPSVRRLSRFGPLLKPGSVTSVKSVAHTQLVTSAAQGADTPSAAPRATPRTIPKAPQGQAQVQPQLPASPTAAAAAAVNLEAAEPVGQHSQGLHTAFGLPAGSQQVTSHGIAAVFEPSSKSDHMRHTAAAEAAASLTYDPADAHCPRSMHSATPSAAVRHVATGSGAAAVSPDTLAATAAHSAAAVVGPHSCPWCCCCCTRVCHFSS